jgi:hypothetical protein
MTSGLFENDMTDTLENYAGLSSHQHDAGLNWGEYVRYQVSCTNVRAARATGMTRMRMGFSDKNWVCFFVLFEAEIDASYCICVIN